MVKKSFSKSMLEKVCNGHRNFKLSLAKEVASYTKTDPMLWIDPDKASGRKKWQKALELSGLVKN